jgi:phosphoadenosine phosphosulfate reductase
VEKATIQAQEVQHLADAYQHAHPDEIIRIALDMFPNITFACSFGAEDMVLLDILMRIRPEANVFYLDTDVLFAETYQLRDEAVKRYGLVNLLQVRPDLSLEDQAKLHGEALWERDPNHCCHLRKVMPLQRVLRQFDAWITGIRREQAPTRANAQVFEADAKFGLIKVNPLAFWSIEEVWDYIKAHDVPYNPLHDQGYPSIGCLHCTRPVAAGEDPRSGRWSGFEKTECGLHK